MTDPIQPDPGTVPDSKFIDNPLVVREIADGEGEAFSVLARRVPAARGGGASPATLWRWAVHGLKGAAGAMIKLEAARVGCRLLSTPAALVRFLAALQPATAAPPRLAPRNSPARGHAEAMASLDRAGL